MPSIDNSHPLWEPEHLRRALDAAGVSLWAWNVETDGFTMDPHGFNLWGIESASIVDFEHLSAKIHPADRDRVREAFNATRAIVGAYEIDFRILSGEEVRWYRPVVLAATRGSTKAGCPVFFST